MRTVDVGVGLVPEQCLDDLDAPAEDCDAQWHPPQRVEGVYVSARIEEELD